VVVAISNEKPEEIRAFIKKNPFPFPVLLDEGGTVGKRYDVSGIPVTCVVDRDGKIVTSLAGFAEEEFRKEIVTRVVPLLNP
jgi:cytochrome c-type biogenesis protein